ncbi:hypothetical protein [Pseudomonas guariconensis]|uniref:hypothetical protein n=1 Tax=Pseudomonas guariconensis TaxID=1288410 RepID=UPI0018AB94A9|nr:hypothetical protein [Pseudomonas guariconensis]MBF8740416.1 hypothetical protein [Pseudomonas guariconensis]MBF8749730.1 hypothetical protein [Pseudomonas guariconensis]
MKRLIHCGELRPEKHSLANIENPFFAVSEVRGSLFYPPSLSGLIDLIHACGSSEPECQLPSHMERILEKVKSGQWVLVTDEPFSPLSRNRDHKCWHLKFRLHQYYMGSGARYEKSNDEFTAAAPAHTALIAPKYGPGKWVKRNIRYHKSVNALHILVNRSRSIANEGQWILSDPADLANTTRTFTHEWVRLEAHERSYAANSAEHWYGSVRHSKQTFLQAQDHWAITGSSWHWEPAIQDIIYERCGDRK